MGRLDGRVAIVTGAGRGLGRSHALFLAEQGACVVVNDLGGTIFGEGADVSAAEQVAEEIVASGGRAVASGHDVANWGQAEELIGLALDTFGELHILVNNAGILRDKTLAKMNEDDWDSVIRVHLKGHAAPSHHAVDYWRRRAKSGASVKASIIHTTSVSGLAGNFGQANYAAAKLGLVALSRVIALEAGHFGVRSNAVSPAARTRILLTVPGIAEQVRPPSDAGELDLFDPSNVSPLIGWLAEENCSATEQIYHIVGNKIFVVSMPQIMHQLESKGRWTLEELDREIPKTILQPPSAEEFFEGIL